MKLLEAVQAEINKALKDRGSIHLIYLSRFGEVDRCSRDIDDVDEPDYAALAEEALTPYFELCTIGVGGTIINTLGREIELGDADALQDALDSAIAERTRFYTEREKVYGASAWPRISRAVAAY